ncbi:methionine ABC transporter ATP-binding protein [Dorea sp. AM58-8]|uniref:methionine ABC transporter ATP-binding protein n=1 Tax=Dorea sp. AM58-8 TaxID=2292346 RepID=UPI000E4BC806|nr:methionine ABC transporter ATP-binding protein [Dorea sp. AM58-8]RGY81694.1 methionine ABC transporter ATP-binding protein [Dorea sp. AM58-8]
MIEITNLKKSFGNLNVLTDINLQIQDGEIYGLVGRSGAGKSTLLRCINRLEEYTAGSIKVDGVEVNSLDKKEIRLFQKDIGMIFQQFPLLSRKTVYENIAFPMRCWKYSKTDIDTRVRELAEIVGIVDKLNEKPSSLSGGQKQRVAIARALSMNPKILLSDEATSALDPVTTKSILDLLKQINEQLGITIVVVTHQMEVVRQVCQKVSLLENGKLVLSGAVEDLFIQQPPELRRFLGETAEVQLKDGANYQILLSDDDKSKKILYHLAKDLNVEYEICGGKTEMYREKELGLLMINVDVSEASKVEKYFTEEKITFYRRK